MEILNARDLPEGSYIDLGDGPKKIIVKIFFSNFVQFTVQGNTPGAYSVPPLEEFQSEDGRVWKIIAPLPPSLEPARKLAERLPAILRRLNDGQLDAGGGDRHTLVRLLRTVCTADSVQSQVLRSEIRSYIEGVEKSQK